MYPTFVEGEDVLVQKEWFFCSVKMNDCFVVKDPRTGRLLLKRIKRIEGNRIFVIGDNEKESTDSRHFGWIKVKDTIGKVISS